MPEGPLGCFGSGRDTHFAPPASQVSMSREVTPVKVPQASKICTSPARSPRPCGQSLTKLGIWQESRKAAASLSSCFWSRTSSWQDSGKRTPAGGGARA